MKIVVDVNQLEAMCRLFQDQTAELAGVSNDVRRRMSDDLFNRLAPYELPGAAVAYGGERVADALAQDAEQLEKLTLTMERLFSTVKNLNNAPGDQPSMAAGQSDLWFFRGGAPALSTFAAPAIATTPVMAPGGVPGADVAGAVGTMGAVGTAGTAAATQPTGASGDLRARIVASCHAWIGTPYGWGGGHAGLLTPHSAPIDCSGLVHQTFSSNGFAISGPARSMFPLGQPVADATAVQPADLAFWGTPSHIHHVAVCIGGGQMIEAPHTGALVRQVPLRYGDFAGFRRVLP